MPGPGDDKDKPLKATLDADPRARSLGTSEPSQAPAKLDLAEAALRALQQRYDMLAEVGRGGMGIVYRARDRETGAVVALKVLRPEIAADTAAVERFKSELLLARKITHKNVCRIYELLRFGDAAVISMEYIEGESLRQFLTRYSAVAIRKGVQWASQICGALSEAHRQGVVHRDLKPENIVIDRDGNVKVMDFGIARSLETTTTTTGVMVGTPAYMAPEQAEGKPADARSDIYSLGLVLYEMFTGQSAFRADTPVAFAMKQIHETPPLPREVEPHLPAFLDRAIRKSLEKSAEKRFQSAAELEAALVEKPESKPSVKAGEEIEVPAHLTRWQRSDWLLVAAAIVGLALFFPFFNRTSLAPRSQVHFERSVLRRIAQEYAQRLGAPVSGDSRIEGWVKAGTYEYLAKAAGARTALELVNNPIPYSVWQVNWGNGAQVTVTDSGALQAFTRGFPSGVSEETLSVEDARALAEKALRDFLDRDPSLLRLEYTAAGEIFSGHPASVLRWVDPQSYYGLKRHYEVWLVGRVIGAISANDEVPVAYNWQYFYRQLLPFFVILVPILVIGFIQRRRVDSTAPWRIIFIAAGVAVFEWRFWPSLHDQPAANLIALSLTIAVMLGFSMFCGSAALERSVQRVAPEKFFSILNPPSRKSAAAQTCGLGVLRGTFAGLALLGLDSFLVWGGTSYLAVRLDSFFQMASLGQFLGRSWPTVGVALGGFSQATVVAGPIVFLSSLAARFLRRFWLVILIPSALTAMFLPGPIISMGAVQPYHWKLVLLFLECLALTLCYARFDALTVFWAALTFAFCWHNYHLLVIFEPAGNAEQWIGFLGFGLIVLGAAALAFRPSLRATYRRLAASFE
jgi:predicted Ser/Thr protein kinase